MSASQDGRGARVHVSLSQLRVTAERVFEAVGLSQVDARAAADALVAADARGVSSHGVSRLPVYVERIRSGGNRATARPEVARQVGATAVVDGHDALGLVVAPFAVEVALGLAKSHGVGVVTCRNSAHFGTAAHHAMTAANRGYIALVISNVNVSMAPWGGLEALLGNNPIAIAAPTSAEPFVVDLALSTVARGKIRLAAKAGTAIPEGWATGPDGRPTTDPHEAVAGLLAPLGGPKGSGLSLAFTLLAALLSGAAVDADLAPQDDVSRSQGVGHFVMVLDIAAFVEVEQFIARVDALLESVRSSRPAAPDRPVLAPGDLERDHQRRAEHDGLELPGETWAAIIECANSLGLTIDTPSQG